MAFTLAQQQVLARPTARPSARRAVCVLPRAAVALKDPPYALDALEPHMSKQTLEFHWGEF
jgi:Fe-Mn family superoxide dismutase